MNVRELMAAVRQFCAENYPACKLEYITIHCRRLAKPIRLAAGPEATTHAPSYDGHRPDEKGDGLSPCILDILKVLREVRKPLSRTRLMEEMTKRGMYWSDRTVARYLAQLMEDGTVENPDEARPRGYRLPQDSE